MGADDHTDCHGDEALRSAESSEPQADGDSSPLGSADAQAHYVVAKGDTFVVAKGDTFEARL